MLLVVALFEFRRYFGRW